MPVTNKKSKQWPPKKKDPAKGKTPKMERKMEKKKSGDSAIAKKKITLKQAVAHRKTLTKGSREYNRVQNFINRASGSKVRHSNENALTEKQMAIAKKQKNTVLAEASVKKKAKRTLAQVGKAAAHAKKKGTEKAINKAFAGIKKKKAKKRIADGK